jgi:hypothetical protein
VRPFGQSHVLLLVVGLEPERVSARTASAGSITPSRAKGPQPRAFMGDVTLRILRNADRSHHCGEIDTRRTALASRRGALATIGQ